MKCPECTREIDTVEKKNKETGMWEQHWACPEHGKVNMDEAMSVNIQLGLEVAARKMQVSLEELGYWDRNNGMYNRAIDYGFKIPQGYEVDPSYGRLIVASTPYVDTRKHYHEIHGISPAKEHKKGYIERIKEYFTK